MKTFSAVILLLLSVVTFSQKDEDDDKKGQLGVLLGWNIAHVSTSGGDLKTGNSHGVYGGVMWEQKIIPSIRAQSGLLFTQNGYSVKNVPGVDYVSLNYLTIPMIGKVQVGPIYGLAGITTGFRVSGNTVYDNGDKEKLSSSEVKAIDFGAQLGLGIQLLIFGIEGRYTWGLTNVSKTEGIDINNRSFQLGVHVHLF